MLRTIFCSPKEWAAKFAMGAKIFQETQKPSDASSKVVSVLETFCQRFGIDYGLWRARQQASIALCVYKFSSSTSPLPLSTWSSRIRALPMYISSEAVESEDKLAWELLPKHVSEMSHSSSSNLTAQSLASAPVICRLCHLGPGFSSCQTLFAHAAKKHSGWAEYRKRLFYLASQNGIQPLLPCVKRNMLQGCACFQQFSAPEFHFIRPLSTIVAAIPFRAPASAIRWFVLLVAIRCAEKSRKCRH